MSAADPAPAAASRRPGPSSSGRTGQGPGGDPAGTQLAVAGIRDQLYQPGPDGLAGNDDLGAESSQFIWEMLGLYPENPGADTLLLGPPGFPHAVISLAGGKTITISAPGAGPTRFYAQSLTINGVADSLLSSTFTTLSSGAVLDWTLATSPTSWGSDPADAPPSYPAEVKTPGNAFDTASFVIFNDLRGPIGCLPRPVDLPRPEYRARPLGSASRWTG